MQVALGAQNRQEFTSAKVGAIKIFLPGFISDLRNRKAISTRF